MPADPAREYLCPWTWPIGVRLLMNRFWMSSLVYLIAGTGFAAAQYAPSGLSPYADGLPIPGQSAGPPPRPAVAPAPSGPPVADPPTGSLTGPPREIVCDDPQPLAPEWEQYWSLRYRNFSNGWIEGDYLLWWLKKSPLSTPLVTSGITGVPNAGAVGALGTNVLFGNSPIDFHDFSGGRVTVGAWCGDHQVFGVEASGFVFDQRTSQATFRSDTFGSPLLGNPFFNLTTGSEDFAEVSTPGQLVGAIVVNSTLRMWGAESNLIINLYRGPDLTFDLLGGFRYLDLSENLQIATSTTPLPGSVVYYNGAAFPTPATTSTLDQYHTQNKFYGGQLGARVEYRYYRLILTATGKLAFGGTSELVSTAGSSSLAVGSSNAATTHGGLYVQPGIPTHILDSAFTAIPETEIKLGFQVNRYLQAFVGYNFLYWMHVVRPGEQIDRNIVPAQVPTFIDFIPGSMSTPTAATVKTTNFWAQGLSFGLVFSF